MLAGRPTLRRRQPWSQARPRRTSAAYGAERARGRAAAPSEAVAVVVARVASAIAIEVDLALVGHVGVDVHGIGGRISIEVDVVDEALRAELVQVGRGTGRGRDAEEDALRIAAEVGGDDVVAAVCLQAHCLGLTRDWVENTKFEATPLLLRKTAA